MEFFESDFKTWLKEQWVRRLDRNPHYSLRSFARDLSWSPSTLSEVLGGKKGVSAATARDAARKLGLGEPECDRVRLLAESSYGRSDRIRKEAGGRLQKMQDEWQGASRLSVDAFKVVSEWYPLAIFELLRMEAFNQNLKRISEELGITQLQTEEAIASLERLELIQKSGKKWKALTETVLSTDGIPSEGLRKFHGQMIDRARSALDVVPVEERDFASFIMGIRHSDMPVIRKRIRKFIQGINEEFSVKPGVKGELDHLVAFSTQLVPIVGVSEKISEKNRSRK